MPLVEILYFDGCPNHQTAARVVRRVAAELEIDADVRMVNVPDVEAAERLRFLGSPSIRVDGRDVEPAAEERQSYQLACRVYRTAEGFSGQPDERWVQTALAEASRAT